MSDTRTHLGATCDQHRACSHLRQSLRALRLTARSALAALVIFSLADVALAQSQPASPPAPQPQVQTQSTPPPQKTMISIADAARKAKSEHDESAPQKVFTNDEAALPPGGISIVGPRPPAPGVAKPKAKSVDDTAKLGEYSKAGFTAARQKLAQDKNALPGLQAQLKVESLQEFIMDPDTGQAYSDTYMDLLHQIDSTNLAIQNDQQPLSDSHDEFLHSGGFPGWIR